MTKNDARYQDDVIPALDNPANPQEGNIAAVEGWLHLVAKEGNDCSTDLNRF